MKLLHYDATSKLPTKPSITSGLPKMVSFLCYLSTPNAAEKKKHVNELHRLVPASVSNHLLTTTLYQWIQLSNTRIQHFVMPL